MVWFTAGANGLTRECIRWGTSSRECLIAGQAHEAIKLGRQLILDASLGHSQLGLVHPCRQATRSSFSTSYKVLCDMCASWTRLSAVVAQSTPGLQQAAAWPLCDASGYLHSLTTLFSSFASVLDRMARVATSSRQLRAGRAIWVVHCRTVDKSCYLVVIENTMIRIYSRLPFVRGSVQTTVRRSKTCVPSGCDQR